MRLVTRLGRFLGKKLSAPPVIRHFSPRVSTEENEKITEPTPGHEGGLTFAIEYRAADGNFSRRRITVIKANDNYISAWCHERKAFRTFRTDRIVCIIDMDGVIHEPPDDFLADVCTVQPGAELSPYEKLREAIRPHLCLLSAIARADGRFTKDEAAVVLDFIRSCSTTVEDGIETVSASDMTKLVNFARRQRPLPQMIEPLIHDVMKGPAATRNLFLGACIPLVEADGKVTDEEVSLLQIINDEMS